MCPEQTWRLERDSWVSPPIPVWWDPFGVARLCAAPTLQGLDEVLLETDVCGDGSCWVYTALAWVGKAEHVLHITPHRAQAQRTRP
jgi:hypothetical protein